MTKKTLQPIVHAARPRSGGSVNMATAEFSCPVPAELSERFSPAEAPSFEVVQVVGETRLWRSTTKACRMRGGREQSSTVHYHITIGDQGDYLLMRDIGAAMANFEAAASQQSKEVRS